MTKHIHVHVHRATTQDSSEWDESKHKRAANGQFGSGGGGVKKPAAKSSAKSEAPAIATRHSNRGATALAQLQAQSNAHLKATGHGHLVKPAKNSPGTGAPAQGEVGSSEKEKYGVYFKKGEVVRLPGGKTAEVISHIGPSVETTAGNFHPTKISAAPRAANPNNVAVQLAGRKEQLAELQKDMKTGKYSPEDMEILRGKEASLKRQIANYEAKAGGAASNNVAVQQADWSKSNGDWAAAKKEGAEMFERAMSSAKSGGARTDVALKLKAEAAEQQKKGSYLGAVVLGLANDYFDRLK